VMKSGPQGVSKGKRRRAAEVAAEVVAHVTP